MDQNELKPIDISNQLHQLQDAHKDDIQTDKQHPEQATEPSTPKQEAPEITRDVLVKFKNIIAEFIKDTAPKIKATKQKDNAGYEAVISKNEVILTTYTADRLKDPITHKFKCSQLTLINQQSKQEEPSFMFEFMKQYQQVFNDISTKKATVEILK
tara:strand:+ start:619 stop:1086 length:468 start_codon:yes stop_codon:yes gene_type:complete